MAKMLKKLQSKTAPPKEEKQQRPPGKDYVLLILMAMSVILVIAAWDTLDTLTITMSILLTLSLGLTYTRRHAADRLTETQMMLVTRGSMVTIGIAGALFLLDAYYRYIA